MQKAIKQQNKILLRKQALANRRQLLPAVIDMKSQKIVEAIRKELAYRQAKVVFLYMPLPEEVQVQSLILDLWSAGKTVCIPYITSLTSGRMEAVRFTSFADLQAEQYYHIKTVPLKEDTLVAPENIDLIIAPGAGYSKQLERLGMGGGFYDRYIPRALGAAVWGVFFAEQELPGGFSTEHDQSLDKIFTDKCIYSK